MNTASTADNAKEPGFGSDLAVTTATNIAIAGIVFLSGPIVARVLGVTGRGQLAAIQTWPSFLAMLGSLGVSSAVIYYAARMVDARGRLLATGLVIGVVGAVVTAPIGYWLMPRLLAAQSADVIALARWYLLFIPVTTVSALPDALLRGANRTLAWNAFRPLANVAWLAVALSALILSLSSPGYVAFAYLIALFILAIVRLIYVVVTLDSPLRFDRALIRPMLGYGAPSLAASVTINLNLRLDQMLMAALLAPRLLGLYAVAASWSSAVDPLLRAIGQVVFPRVAHERDENTRIAIVARSVRVTSILALCLALGLFVVTPWAVPQLFGRDFAAAVPAAQILVFAGAINTTKRVLQEGARGFGLPRTVMWSEIVGLACAGAMLWLLLERYDIIGAAIASVVGYGVSVVLLAFMLKPTTGLRPHRLIIPSWEDIVLLRKVLTDLVKTRIRRSRNR